MMETQRDISVIQERLDARFGQALYEAKIKEAQHELERTNLDKLEQHEVQFQSFIPKTHHLRQVWWIKNHILAAFVEEAERRVSTPDPFGDERWETLLPLARKALIKLLEGTPVSYSKKVEMIFRKRGLLGNFNITMLDDLVDYFTLYHTVRRLRRQVHPSDITDLTGQEFEVALEDVLKRAGFTDIQRTGFSRDQGADLIATRGDKRYVIQAKQWRKPVGNGAVQEVVAALRFYDGDVPLVVATTGFTPSAKALAQANGVILISGGSLQELEHKLMLIQ